jgi:hypothetical protein
LYSTPGGVGLERRSDAHRLDGAAPFSRNCGLPQAIFPHGEYEFQRIKKEITAMRTSAFWLPLIALLFGSVASIASVPAGFEEPGLVDQLLKGKIIYKDLTSSTRELRVLYRSYFRGITAADYVAKIEQHDEYRKWFSSIKDSRRLDTLVAGEKYLYEVSTEVATPVGKKTVTPEVEQTVALATLPDAESTVVDKVQNYASDIHTGGMETRLVPYKGGLLVAHTAHVHLKNYLLIASAKQGFRKGFYDMLSELRNELKANP